MAVTLAFYKGRGKTSWQRIQDTAIRMATRGIYSHVELIAGSAYHGETHRCLSSSGRDGGVRAKRIRLRSESWDLVALDLDPGQPAAFIEERIGAAYDLLGAITCPFPMPRRLQNPNRWYCSEIVAAALGSEQAHRISPQMLFDRLCRYR